MHDFTVLPSSTTVQAPQLLVSQPTCVPVNPSMIADKVNQQQPRFDVGLALAAIHFDVNRLFFAMGFLPIAEDFYLPARSQRARERPLRQFFDQTFLIFHRATQIGTRVRFVGCQLRRLCDVGFVQLLAAQKVFRFAGFHRRWAHVGETDALPSGSCLCRPESVERRRRPWQNLRPCAPA